MTRLSGVGSRNTPAMDQTFSPVQQLLERLHSRHAEDDSGEVASYIPELATADPSWFGIALVTAGGTVYEVGDTRREFTIQSISKPLTYALALEAIGEEEVRRHVDVEPSGEAFNSITLQKGTGIPPNPMVNAGAIATASLIEPLGFEKPIDRILNEYSAFAGRELTVDEAVYESENRTGSRNRAIAYLLQNSGVLKEGTGGVVEGVVETYFRQCSTLVDCRDLATIAATLASTGVNPVTGSRVLREDTVRDVLSVLASCGMYDAAGDWLYSVGLPAKSGVAGGIIAVLPGQLGIAVYSPPLDEHGNSVRGIRVCEELSGQLDLHVMTPARRPPPPVRAERTLAEARSMRLRPESEQEVLREFGHRARVLELQGEITFAGGELVTRNVLDRAGDTDITLIDLAAVRAINQVDVPIVSDLVDSYGELGGELVFSALDGLPEFSESLARFRRARDLETPKGFSDLDAGLEWCERQLIERHGEASEPVRLALQQHGATLGMSPEQVARLNRRLEPRTYAAGEQIYSVEDTETDEMLLVASGSISLFAGQTASELHRIATLPAGMTLNEIPLISRRSRLGTSRADTEVTAWALSHESLDQLRAEDPDLVCTLLENFLKMLAVRVGHMARDLLR